MRQAGSIIKKRKRWYVVYRTVAGKQKWEGGFETKGQAQNRLTEVLGQIQTGGYIEPSEMTFGEFADQWLKNRVNIRAATRQGYESYLKIHVNPQLEQMKLREIRHSHIQAMIAAFVQKDTRLGRLLSAATIHKICTMLKSIFKSAMKNDLIHANPAQYIEQPTTIKIKIQPPDKKDVLAILQQAPSEYRALFLLDSMTGLRRGEILALQWKDIDWINQEALIERSISKKRCDDGAHKYGWAIGPTKSGRLRRVGIPPIVIQSLQGMKPLNLQSEDQFIFTRNGTFIDPDYFSKYIALPLVKRATEGRVKRFHDLRHFFTSLLISNGENAKYIQDQVGHASIATTYDVYGHLMPQAKQQATKKLERSLFGKKANVRTLLEQNATNANLETVN
jgi:integrase